MLASLPPPGRGRWLIGVSGGRDSMTLLTILADAGWDNLVVCHLDHGLRGAASRRDAAFVGAAARRLGLPSELGRAETRRRAGQLGQSLELAARELRLEFFRDCARRHRCRRLLLAHHADDQVETILFHFLRGAGLAGLAGMRSPARHGILHIHRPLLAVSREEIGRFAAARAIAHRDDASNTSDRHTRNRLRHTVLPALDAAFGPSFRQAVLRTASIVAAENDLLESLTPPVEAMLETARLRALPLALRRRQVLAWLRRHRIAESGYAEVERVLDLLREGGPARINLPGDRHARRRQGRIFLS